MTNQIRSFRLAFCLLLALSVTLLNLSAETASSPSFSQADLEFFERRIRPVLADACYECHSHREHKSKGGLYLDSRSGVLRGGDSGSAIRSEHPEKSLLLEAIGYQNVDLQMPPKTRLNDAQIRDFETWVQKGLPWPDEPEPTSGKAEEDAFDLEERKSGHWVWNPPQMHPVPEVQNQDWVQSPVDAFILNRLEAAQVTPAEPADQRTLLRRAYLILTGLPPSPAEIDAFLEDPDPNAYEKVVDQLLDSQHFGERWGRHWLDLVRYAETMGHEFDYAIPNAWRYRDYVIRAFNQDLPFDQFAREHIAGDLLPSPRMRADTGENESVIGTGFYWLGQQVHSPVDIRMNQLDVLDNQMDVLSKTFQGLTVTCARCHDHKFDAISTKDFYGLYGMVKSSRYQQTTLWPLERTEDQREALAEIQSKAKTILAESGLAPATRDASSSDLAEADGWVLLGDAQTDGFQGWFFDDEAMADHPLVQAGDLVHRGGDQPVQWAPRTAVDSAKWSLHLQGSLRSPTFEIGKRYLHVYAAGKKSRVNVVIDNFNLIRAPIYGGLKKNLNHDEAKWLTFDLDMWQGHEAYVEIKDTVHADLSGGGAHGPQAWFSVETVLASTESKAPQLERNSFELPSEKIPEALKAHMTAYAALADDIEVAPVAVSMTEGSGTDESVFIRGNPKRLGDSVPRRFLLALGGEHVAHAGSGRLELARHIADPKNPLTGRVYVNRVWHHLFGKGLVETVDDFGVLGRTPSHPELLDWLAVWFVNEGQWSTKQLIRMLVLSSTFRMDSKATSPEMDEKDAANVLLHKMRVRRLEGESIRDTILKVSGQLDPRPFGPSEKIHLTSFMTGRGRPGKSGPLDGGRRRSIYVEVRRNFLSPFLTTFDTPIPYTTFGKRAQSNVPAQSLILMNDPFVLQQAKAWSEKLVQQEGSVASKLTWMYETAFGRLPLPEESRKARAFLANQSRAYHSAGSDPDTSNQRAWSDLCHVLFNVKEFVYIH